MTEWRPSVVKIEKIENHPNADSLSIATVLGDYPVVFKTGQYSLNELVGYIPVDTIVPDTEEWYFLCPMSYEKYDDNGKIKTRITNIPQFTLGAVPEKYRRIKAKRLRNIYSQGLLTKCPDGFNLNDSLVEHFNLIKYEEPDAEENIHHNFKGRAANAEKAPQDWNLPYYDIEGLRKYLNCIKLDEEIVLTEKLDGSNAVFVHDGSRLWCKSRNYFKKFDPQDPWWDIAIRYDLENKLSKYPMMAFWGELYGKVKKMPYDLKIEGGQMHSKIRFFDIYDVKNQKFVDYDQFKDFIKETNLEQTTELYRGKWLDKETMYKYAEGITTLGKHLREGFVVKPTVERFEPKLRGRMILKLVGEGYQLQK